MEPIYKGNVDNQKQAKGSRKFAESKTKTVFIKGKKASLEVYQDTLYAVGQTYEGIWKIASTDLANLPGGMAELALNLVISGSTGESGPEPISTIDTWEINWQSVEKSIVQNPNLLGAYAGSDAENEPYRQTVADQVASWREAPLNRKRRFQAAKANLDHSPSANVDADWEDLGAEALKIAKKINKGIEAYLVFSPVITLTQVYSQMPTTGACGTRNTPTVNIAGYVYLKNADRAVQQQDKTWQRVQSWQGADAWDPDLYPES
jgi:hypothetical protein